MRTTIVCVVLLVLSIDVIALSAQVDARLAARTGVPERRTDAAGTAIPPGVTLADGLTEGEAVATALWNNPAFRAQLTDLGFARVDLLEAGLLRNPVLSLLFPLGPKQFEATLRWPIEVLWERPRRVAAARLAVDRVAATLEQSGLDLVLEVKVAHADLLLARDRAELTERTATERERIRELTLSRFSAGDISELEARSAAIDAATARQDAQRARSEITIRANDLRGRMGLAFDTAASPAVLVPAANDDGALRSADCATSANALEDALASRPDVRAAEIAIEEAGHRLGWEKSKILAVTAALDANGSGSEGFEMGPGIDIPVPLFDRNQAGRARASAQLERASLAYAATRQRVATEIRDAAARWEQALAFATGLRDTVLSPLEGQLRSADQAYQAGDVSYLFVLETTRRLTDARIRTREADAEVARARALVERALGRSCAAGVSNGV